jgi:adenine-specific DNA-methyltransferase
VQPATKWLRCATVIKPFLAGRDIKRYQHLNSDRFLILFPKGYTIKELSLTNEDECWTLLSLRFKPITEHLENFKDKAKARCDKGDYWWEMRACEYYREFDKPKLMLPDISLRGNFAYDDGGIFCCVNTAYIIPTNDKYLMGILNSHLITFIYSKLSSTYQGGYLRFIYQYLAQLPIRSIEPNNAYDVTVRDEIITLVETMLKLHEALATANNKDVFKRQIEAADRRIDTLVYQLYGLTDDEINIVAGY